MDEKRLKHLAGIVTEGQQYPSSDAMLRSLLSTMKDWIENAEYDDRICPEAVDDIRDMYEEFMNASVSQPRGAGRIYRG